jgi:hypothetical protein
MDEDQIDYDTPTVTGQRMYMGPDTDMTPEELDAQKLLQEADRKRWITLRQNREKEQNERMAKQVSFMLDMAQQHPVILELFSIKRESKKERYLKMILPSMIAQWDGKLSTKQIAFSANDMADEMIALEG